MIWLRSVIAAPHRSTAQSLVAASFFAVQIGAAASVLGLAYAAARQRTGTTWAIVSAVLVLYPGITQSMSAALLRIAANLLGSAIGFGVGSIMGTGMPQLIFALVVTIFAGELLRMDLALRTACVASIIVMSVSDGEHTLGMSVVERVAAVLAGCTAALLIQWATTPLRRLLPFVAIAEATGGADAKPRKQETE